MRLWQAHVEVAAVNGSPTKAAGKVPGTILAADKQGIRVLTGDGVLTLTELQLPGGKALPVRDVLNSRAAWFAPDQQFGQPDATAGADA